MKLWLLRHGEAESFAPTDAQRRLTEAGQAAVRSVCQYLPAHLSHILVSPYLRAQQTAELVLASQTGTPLLTTVDWLVPETNPLQVMAALDNFRHEDLLLVAHQPLLGELAGLLIHGHRQQPLPLPTATLVELEAPEWLAGMVELCGVYSPA